MSWQVALRLGRVSNLPTVWTNTADRHRARRRRARQPDDPAAAGRALAVLCRRDVSERCVRCPDRRDRAARAADPVGRDQRARRVRRRLRHVGGGRPAAALDRLRPHGRHRPLVWRLRTGACGRDRALRLAPQGQPAEPGAHGALSRAGLPHRRPRPGRAAAGGPVAGGVAAALLPDRAHLRRQAGEPRRGQEPVAAAVPGGADDLRAGRMPRRARPAP